MNKRELRDIIRSNIAAALDQYVESGGKRPSSIDVEMIDVTTILDENTEHQLGEVLLEWPDYETAEIKSLIRDLRAVAEPVGSLHGFWDLIFELESAARIDGVTERARNIGFASKKDLIDEGKRYLAEHRSK